MTYGKFKMAHDERWSPAAAAGADTDDDTGCSSIRLIFQELYTALSGVKWNLLSTGC